MKVYRRKTVTSYLTSVLLHLNQQSTLGLKKVTVETMWTNELPEDVACVVGADELCCNCISHQLVDEVVVPVFLSAVYPVVFWFHHVSLVCMFLPQWAQCNLSLTWLPWPTPCPLLLPQPNLLPLSALPAKAECSRLAWENPASLICGFLHLEWVRKLFL